MAEFTAGERVVGLRSAYVVGERLGEGGFGLAFVATADDGRRFVLKQLRVARMGDWKAMELFERDDGSRCEPALPAPQARSLPALVDKAPLYGAASCGTTRGSRPPSDSHPATPSPRHPDSPRRADRRDSLIASWSSS